jgi:hypothetical protein
MTTICVVGSHVYKVPRAPDVLESNYFVHPRFLAITQWSLRERDVACSSQNRNFETDWFFNITPWVSRRETLQVLLRRAATASEPWLLRETQVSCDSRLEELFVVFCILFVFVASAVISFKFRCKVLLQTLKNFWISSRCASNIKQH